MPSRKDMSRAGSHQSSESGPESSSIRVRITQERTTERETVEFGMGPQQSYSGHHQSISFSGYPRGRILCDIDADKFSGLFGEFGYDSDPSY